MNAIIIKKLVKQYGDRQVLSGIDLCVRSGFIHGLLGPNGAGKTTAMKAITGLLRYDSGSIDFPALSTNLSNSYQKSNMGVLIEDPPLYMDMLVEEYLIYIAKLKKVDKALIQEYVDDCISKLDLESVRKRMIGNLSKGYKQRIGIAQAIVHRPSIVILDEPTVGLDPQSVIEIRNIILNLKGDHTVLLSSHLLHEMSLVCDDISILNNGKILESGPLNIVREKIFSSGKLLIRAKEIPCNFILAVEALEPVVSTKMNKDELEIIGTTSDEVKLEISKLVVEHKLQLLEFSSRPSSLEDIFLKVTEKL